MPEVLHKGKSLNLPLLQDGLISNQWEVGRLG